MKGWIIEAAIKRFGPSAIRGGVLALVGLLAAYQGVLQTFGVFYDEAAKTITIHLGTLESALIVLAISSTAGLIKVLNHEGTKVLPKKVSPESTPPAA